MAPRKEVRDKRKKQLTRAAMQCIVEKGYDQVTLEDVCRAAGMSRGITCYYFKNKEELLATVLQRMLDDADEVIRTFIGFDGRRVEDEEIEVAFRSFVSEHDPAMLIQRGIEALIHYFDQHPEMVFVFLEFGSRISRNPLVAEISGRISERLWSIGEIVIAEGISRGVFPARDPRMAAQMLVSSGVGILQTAVLHRDLFFKLGPFAEEITAMVMRYLSGPPVVAAARMKKSAKRRSNPR